MGATTRRAINDRAASGSAKFTKMVQVGRVAYIVDGLYKGHLAVIVNPIDSKWVLILRPLSGQPKQKIHINKLKLTNYVIKIQHQSSDAQIKQVFETDKIADKWSVTGFAKKEKARQIRSQLNDFERFQVQRLKKKRNQLVKKFVKESLKAKIAGKA